MTPTNQRKTKDCSHQFVGYTDRQFAHPFVCILCGEKRLVGHKGLILIYDKDEELYKEQS